MTTRFAPPNEPDEQGTSHALDDPPEFHQKLLDYGERPYWSPDGARIAFIESNYGDVCEIELATRRVRNLTRRLGDHHSFLRVLFMRSGDYLLIGPREFKNRFVSRYVESELWWMDRNAMRPPVPLGKRLFEGIGVSSTADRITYAVNGRRDASRGATDAFECRVADVVVDADGPSVPNERAVYRTESGTGRSPEPQDFRAGDREVIFAEYVDVERLGRDAPVCVVKGVEIDGARVRTYISEARVHNECEGIFPDQDHCCLESSVDSGPAHPQSTDLWKLKLDGTSRRVRMTRMCDRPPWRATNSNVSPDGRCLAFMLNRHGDEPGYGRGLGLLDLAAWAALRRRTPGRRPPRPAERRVRDGSAPGHRPTA